MFKNFSEAVAHAKPLSDKSGQRTIGNVVEYKSKQVDRTPTHDVLGYGPCVHYKVDNKEHLVKGIVYAAVPVVYNGIKFSLPPSFKCYKTNGRYKFGAAGMLMPDVAVVFVFTDKGLVPYLTKASGPGNKIGLSLSPGFEAMKATEDCLTEIASKIMPTPGTYSVLICGTLAGIRTESTKSIARKVHLVDVSFAAKCLHKLDADQVKNDDLSDFGC